jgi:phosphopantetheinyl transferase
VTERTTGPRQPGFKLFWLSQASQAALEENVLSAAEHVRFLRMRSKTRRAEFVRGRALLRFALWREDMPLHTLITEAGGRPSLRSGGDVSLSHSGDHAVVGVVQHGRAGVDVEHARPRERALMDRFFHPDELAWASDNVTRLHVLWTLKESALKALGTGIAGDPLRVHCRPWEKHLSLATLDGERVLSHQWACYGEVVMAAAWMGPASASFQLEHVTPAEMMAWAAGAAMPLRDTA